MRAILSTAWIATYAIALVLLLRTPTDFVLFVPGPVIDAEDMLVPRAQSPARQGHLFVTTVGTVPYADMLKLIEATLTPSASAMPRDLLLPNGQSLLEFQSVGRRQAVESTATAEVVALRYAGVDADLWGAGAEIVALPEPAPSGLLPGDVVVGAGDSPIRTAWDLESLVGRMAPGETVTLRVLREQSQVKAGVQVQQSSYGEPTLGLVVLTAGLQVIASQQIKVQSPDVVGPSAGLMMALAVLDHLSTDGLTRGHSIAGTGIINPTGAVESVAGVVQKVVAAERAGAELFLTPLDNYREAARAARKMKVVPVGSFREAVEFLGSLPHQPSAVSNQPSGERKLTAER